MGLFGGLRIIPFILHISLCFRRQRTGLYYQQTNARQKNEDSTLEALYFYNGVSDQQQCTFLQPQHHFKGHFCLHTLPFDEEKAHLGKHSGASGIPEQLLEDQC